MRYWVSQAGEGEWIPIVGSVENQYPPNARDQVLYGVLFKMGTILPMPKEDWALPLVWVVMAGSTLSPNVAKYVVVGPVPVVSVKPVAATFLGWYLQDFVDVVSGVRLSNSVHGLSNLGKKRLPRKGSVCR